MSYFVFGCLELDDSSHDRVAEMGTVMQAEASHQRLHVFLNGQGMQRHLSDMLQEQVGTAVTCSFFIASDEGEDTSESLISPFDIVNGEGLEGLFRIERWVAGVAKAFPKHKLSLFIVDGYDIDFRQKVVTDHRWAEDVARQIAEEGQVPSLRLDFPPGQLVRHQAQ